MKTIRTRSDLAIHGAPPAFVEPLHVGRPNIGNRERFLELTGQMLDRAWLTNNGPLVQELEARLARLLQVRNCVAMCNGTIALEIAVRALDLKGEVIVPSFTFIATAHALHWQAVTPVFADIDPLTHNLDPDSVLRCLTSRTTGIIGVHVWGRAAPIAALEAIAAENGLGLMFDAAHAFGATSGGRPIGNFGRCEVLSFHATKYFSSGEGGAVVTNDDDLAERMRLMRNFGFAGLDRVIYPGTNGKMTEMSAAFGLSNLESLDAILERNRRNYVFYREQLDGIYGLSLLRYSDSEASSFQYIVLEVASHQRFSRDDLVSALRAENVLARRYFWPGCHRMQPYRDLYPDAGQGLPWTERVSERVIVLPTGLGIAEEEIRTIVQILRVLVER